MEGTESKTNQYPPKLHNEVYPFIYPAKFRGALKEKVTIITGAAGTIGVALAECFAVAGAKLVLTYNRTHSPASISERCLELGASAVEFVQCNVSDLESCRKLVDGVLEKHGNVDILINNAGSNYLGLIHDQAPEDFINDLAVNLHGPYFLMRQLIPHFRTRRSGCVLNICSRGGTITYPYSTSYAASKAALINLTGCIQKEFDAEGFADVHMYALHPGGIKSVMTLKKYGTESVSKLPDVAKQRFTNILDIYNDSPYLNGMTCVALAAGVAKDSMRGRYIDVVQDLEDIVKQADAVKADREMYTLHTKFLGGLSNLTWPEVKEEPFEFPGF